MAITIGIDSRERPPSTWGRFHVAAVSGRAAAPSMRALPNLATYTFRGVTRIEFTQTGESLADAAEAATLLVEPHGFRIVRVEVM